MTAAFDPGPPIGYADGGEWLAAFVRAETTGDGDAFVTLFTDDVELQADPFDAPLVGHNAIRAYLGSLALAETQLDVTMERHWVSGATILAAWHATFVRATDRAHVRQAGFLTAEIRSGRCTRLRLWTLIRQPAAG
ncbi:MAG TPA: nuclear transport factor 2 family protein [Candidatus Saccharimonadales bacterium]|nr:nuclear transport factor 2 family protein [Candidatus Saccharimonadales bacterium]